MDLKFQEKVAKQLVNKGYIKKAEETSYADLPENKAYDMLESGEVTLEDSNYEKVLKKALYGDFNTNAYFLILKDIVKKDNPYYKEVLDKVKGDNLIYLVKRNKVPKNLDNYDEVIKKCIDYSPLACLQAKIVKKGDNNREYLLSKLTDPFSCFSAIKYWGVTSDEPYYDKILEQAKKSEYAEELDDELKKVDMTKN